MGKSCRMLYEEPSQLVAVAGCPSFSSLCGSRSLLLGKLDSDYSRTVADNFFLSGPLREGIFVAAVYRADMDMDMCPCPCVVSSSRAYTC